MSNLSKYSDFDSSRIAHLTMIQSIISRLEGNAFAIKALTMTLGAAVLAFTRVFGDKHGVDPVAALLPVTVFWLLDAYYLRLGRMFRHLYVAVQSDSVQAPFSMDLSPFQSAEQGLIRVAFSLPLFLYYAAIALVLAVMILIASAKG